VSTDIIAVAVLDPSGAVVACGPGVAGTGLREAAAQLWDAAAARASLDGAAALEHVVVPFSGGAIAVVHAHGHRAVALTGARPAVALLLFDLRTCLDDARAHGKVTA
jgi:hypothetical protein